MAHDLVASVLASLAATYEVPSQPIDDGTVSRPEETVIGRNLPDATVKAMRRGNQAPIVSTSDDGSVAAPPSDQPPIVGIELPQAGTLEARGFLMAMRSAGVRKGKLDLSVKREDEIRAIAAYCGYDPRKLHGEQEAAARAKAQRELKPIVIKPGEKAWNRSGTADPTVHGYVQGAFDARQRKIDHLKGQEVVCAEALCAHRNEFMNASQPLEARAKAQLLMKLEEERLAAIRADLRALGEEV